MPEAVEKLGKLRIEVGLHARKTGIQKSTEGRTGFIGKGSCIVSGPFLNLCCQCQCRWERRRTGRRDAGARVHKVNRINLDSSSFRPPPRPAPSRDDPEVSRPSRSVITLS